PSRSGRPALGLLTERGERTTDAALEEHARAAGKHAREQPAPRLLGADERAAFRRLQPIAVAGVHAESPARPADRPLRLDLLEPRSDPEPAGLPPEGRAGLERTREPRVLDLVLPARPVLDPGEKCPDDRRWCGDRRAAAHDHRRRLVDPHQTSFSSWMRRAPSAIERRRYSPTSMISSISSASS